jgi:hypothetical protein
MLVVVGLLIIFVIIGFTPSGENNVRHIAELPYMVISE